MSRGARVDADADIVQVTSESQPSATFDVPTGSLENGAEVTVASQDDPGLTATCKVTKTAPGSATVECPADSGLLEGSTIVLKQ